MFAHDRGWVDRLHEAIENGLSAEAAVERVQNDTRARMQRQTDPYIRDRLHDLDDLANRLLRILTGDGAPFRHKELPENAILVARNMGPAELLEYDRSRLRGLVLEEGAAISHVAIIAKSLGLVAVGQAKDIVSMCEDGDDIIVDGSAGKVHLRPTPEVVQVYVDKVQAVGQAAGALRRAQAPAGDQPRRRRDHAAAQFRAGRRPADARRHRRRGRRAVPHRAAVHDREQAAAALRAGRALPPGDGDRRRPADRVPAARYRRRQGHSVPPLRGRGEPGDGLALAAPRARPAGAAAAPDPGAAAGGGRAAAQDPRADGDRGLGVPRDPAGAHQGGRAAAACGRSGAGQARARRDDRGALAAVRARPGAARGRFRLDRLERPGAVPHRRRPRQSAGRAQLRSRSRCRGCGRSATSSIWRSASACRSPCAASLPAGRSRRWR